MFRAKTFSSKVILLLKLRKWFPDPDRAVDSNEQYQKNNVNNDQSAPSANMGDDEVMQKIEVKGDEFSGLIGNIAGNLIRDKVGGPGGDILAGLAGNVLGGGGGGGGYSNNYGGGGDFFGGGGLAPEPPPKKKSTKKKALNFLGGLIGVKKKEEKKGSTWTP
ncbi:hypothetical protein Y032_0038g3665 [Ancylostoma ceylanicum]|uniref:Uncharacterized protein n=1 Tax=Ancylostoma ceylanicum TaxID=53326 RepID=A0A016UK05_9BILA|nr:hypothetical protein Y032_0038g3665 [Ancylostoma ceylanicum]